MADVLVTTDPPKPSKAAGFLAFLMGIGVGVAAAWVYREGQRSDPWKDAPSPRLKRDSVVYRGIRISLQQEPNGTWTGCFGMVKGDNGECWPGATRAAALSKTAARVNARLDIER
jgi:hypothetical protein